MGVECSWTYCDQVTSWNWSNCSPVRITWYDMQMLRFAAPQTIDRRICVESFTVKQSEWVSLVRRTISSILSGLEACEIWMRTTHTCPLYCHSHVNGPHMKFPLHSISWSVNHIYYILICNSSLSPITMLNHCFDFQLSYFWPLKCGKDLIGRIPQTFGKLVTSTHHTHHTHQCRLISIDALQIYQLILF